MLIVSFQPLKATSFSIKKLKYLVTEVAGLDWDTVDFTSILEQRLPRKTKPPKELVQEGRQRVYAEVTSYETIVVLDNKVTKLFFPKSKYGELRGKLQSWTHPETGYEHTVVPMHDPIIAAPGHSPGMYKTLEADWRCFISGDGPGQYNLVDADTALSLFRANYHVPFAFDFETENNHWPALDTPVDDPKRDYTFQAIRSRSIGWSFCFYEGEAYYCTAPIELLREILEDGEWRKYVHNALFEYTVCANHGITLRGFHDTKVMAFLLGEPSSHLKDLSSSLLGIRQTKFDEVDWDNIEEVAQYGAADSDYTLRIAHILEPRLYGAERLLSVYDDIDVPVIAPISRCQRDGFYVDVERLSRVRTEAESDLREVRDYLVKEYGSDDINFNSATQIADWLYGNPETGHWKEESALKTRSHIRWVRPGLGLPIPSYTDKGQPKTDINSLLGLQHPVADALVKLSSLEKFLSGHARTFMFLPQEDGRVHPSYTLSGHWEVDDEDKALAPRTGRLSSTGPNAQQITNFGDDSRPYVFHYGQELRRCVQPAPGFVFIESDFAQQEPRIGAMVSGDTYMDHLLQTADVYKPAAADLYHVSVDDITKDQRQIGKRAWMAWLNRARHTGIQRSAWWLTNEEAEEWCETQDATYQDFTDWALEQYRFLLKHGYVETWFGRRIDIPESQSPLKSDREAAYRACIPGIIQGTGADIFKKTFILADPFVRSLGGRIPLLVHDAIYSEVPIDRAQEVINFFRHISEGMMPSPLPIETLVGPNWSKLDMKEEFCSCLKCT